MSERFTLFYRGPFSQWFGSRFVVDGIEYVCAEQYMMAEKARLFGDDHRLKRIMATAYPRNQKAEGRLIANFDPVGWNAVAKDVVRRANLAKFGQNANLLKQLIDTAGTTLVECSPKDTVWGIGLAQDDPRALDRAQWLGTNWLGEVLTQVRDTLLAFDGWGKDQSTIVDTKGNALKLSDIERAAAIMLNRGGR